MLHNVLRRQLTAGIEPERIELAARRGRHRPRPAAADASRWGSGSGCWRRSARCPGRVRDRGPVTAAAGDPLRRLTPGRPARAGEAQPDARGDRAPRRRLPRPALRDGPARPRGPAVGRRRAVRRRRLAAPDGLRRRAAGPGPRPPGVRGGATRGRCRLGRVGAATAARGAAREADPGRGRARPAARPMPQQRWTRPWRRGATELDADARHAASPRRSARTCRSSSPAARRWWRDAASSVTPLPWLKGGGEPPGLLLVTPAVPVSTPDAFAAYAAGIRGSAARRGWPRSTWRRSSGRGLTCARPPRPRGRARRPRTTSSRAADAVVPELVPFRRALRRVHGPARRPVRAPDPPTGRSILRSPRPSRPPRRSARRSRRARSRARLGRRRSSPRPRSVEPGPPAGEGSARMTRQAISTTGAPAAVGPYSQAIAAGDLVFCAGPARPRPGHRRPRRRRRRGADRARPEEPHRRARRGRPHVRERGEDHDLPRPTSTTSRPSTRSTPRTCPSRRPAARRSPSRPCPKGALVEIEAIASIR